MAATASIPELRYIEPLRRDQKVLVVGVLPDNLPRDLRNHDQVIVWEQGSPQISRSNIPGDVVLVLITRFNDHVDVQRVRKMCASRHIRYETRLQTTGAVRRTLRILLGQEQPTALNNLITQSEEEMRSSPHATHPVPFVSKLGDVPIKHVEQKQEPVKKYKSVSQFIKENFTLLEGETVIATAARRLLPQLKETGLPFEEKNFFTMCAAHARKLGLVSGKRRSTEQLLAKPVAAITLPPLDISDKPVTKQVPDKEPEISKTDSNEDILRLLDDASAAIQLAREQLALLSTENKKYKTFYEQMKQAVKSADEVK